MENIWSRWGGLAGVLVTVALLTLPLMQYCGTSSSSDGVTETRCVSSTLIESQGGRLEAGTWIYLGLMTGVTALCGAWAWRAASPAQAHPFLLLLLALIPAFGMLLGAFSIGLYYAPAVGFSAFGALVLVAARASGGAQRALSNP